MLRVGLTGGAGSGKSTIAAMLRQMGAFVSRSDEVGRAMMQPGHEVYRQIVEYFGPEVIRPDGLLDRAVLARIAFQDGRVEELNRIVHPAVIAAQRDWMDGVAAQSPMGVAVVESALLFETKRGAATHDSPWRTRFDRIVLVTAPEAIRLQRYMAREKASGQDALQLERDARARFAAQMGDAEKAAMSDFVLINEGTPDELQTKVERLYAALQSESADRRSEAM